LNNEEKRWRENEYSVVIEPTKTLVNKGFAGCMLPN